MDSYSAAKWHNGINKLAGCELYPFTVYNNGYGAGICIVQERQHLIAAGVACTILATFPLKVTTMSALSLLKYEPRITVSEPGKPEFGEIEVA